MPGDRLVEFMLNLIKDLFGWRDIRALHHGNEFPAFQPKQALGFVFVHALCAKQFEYRKLAQSRGQFGSRKLIIESLGRQINFESHNSSLPSSRVSNITPNIFAEFPQSAEPCQFASRVAVDVGIGDFADRRDYGRIGAGNHSRAAA
jgi:hypothetical protein